MARTEGTRSVASSAANTALPCSPSGSITDAPSREQGAAVGVWAPRMITISSLYDPTGTVGHCPLLSLWCVKESGCLGFHLDAKASALSVADVDGGQLAVSDLLKHGGPG